MRLRNIIESHHAVAESEKKECAEGDDAPERYLVWYVRSVKGRSIETLVDAIKPPK